MRLYGGGSPAPISYSRVTPIDASTVVNWKLTETAAPYANSGTAGTLNLTSGGANAPIPGIVGTVDKCVYCNNASTRYLTTAATSTGEVTGSVITVSLWVNLSQHTAWGGILQKCMYLASNTDASSILFQQTDVSGAWSQNLPTSTLAYGWTFTEPENLLVYGKWSMLGVTYDGSTMKYFKDGRMIRSRAATGTIDYGTHGAWRIMQRADGVVSTGYIEDVRVESVARSESYMMDMYKRGVGFLV